MTVTTDNSQTLVNALVEIERLNDRLLMVEAILAGNGALITGLKAEVARLEPLQYRQASPQAQCLWCKSLNGMQRLSMRLPIRCVTWWKGLRYENPTPPPPRATHLHVDKAGRRNDQSRYGGCVQRRN